MKRTCKQCGREFELTDSQVEWYKSKGLEVPKRCEECRAANKEQRGTSPDGRKQAASIPEATRGETGPNAAEQGEPSKPKTPVRGVIGAVIAFALAATVGGNAILGHGQDADGAPSTPAASVSSSSTVAGTASASVSASTSSADVTYRFRDKSRLNEHYRKHGIEMGFSDAQSYEQAANAVAHDPQALHKLEKEDGDDVYYLESTDEIVFISQDGYIRTYFNPGGIDYFNRQ